MPQRSKIAGLPDSVKADLNKRLVKGGFSDYEKLAAWLQEQGFEISRSAVHRYGQAFEERLAAIKIATEQAQAIAEAVGDDEGAMNEALIRLVQEKSFDVLVNLQTKDPDAFAKIFPKLGVMIAKLSRASVDQKKWRAEVKKRAELAVENIEAKAKKNMDPKLLKLVKEEIYGIV